MTRPGESRIKVLLADDHPVVLEGVGHLIRESADLELVGEVNTGSKALRAIAATCPRVAVLDISMPDLHGIAVAQQLAAENCPTRIVMLSAYEEQVYVRQALTAGARGYVLKRSAGDNLLQAIRAVSDNGFYLDPLIAGHILYSGRRPAEASAARSPLTDREHDVLRLIALGFTNKEIAGKLSVNEKSVESYKARATEKLGLRTRAKIVQYGVLQGWFQQLAASNSGYL